MVLVYVLTYKGYIDGIHGTTYKQHHGSYGDDTPPKPSLSTALMGLVGLPGLPGTLEQDPSDSLPGDLSRTRRATT